MKDTKSKIRLILAEDPIREYHETSREADRYMPVDDFEPSEFYADLYLLVKNVDAFYGPRSEPKAARLLESFILESLVVCKNDPEVMLVESGDDYVKATAFTPDGESGVELFDDAVDINSMLETYNLALAENGYPQIEAGIGLAAFQERVADDELPDPDDVAIGEPQSGYDVAYDGRELAIRLAELANGGEFDPIVMDETFYGILADLDDEKRFLDENMRKVDFEGEDFAVYHGNIVLDEE
ncbi:MAG: hypothetical protein Q8N15_05470 [Bacillota bacterium]|nr:hypothetical protein [Bacillota bacterium]